MLRDARAYRSDILESCNAIDAAIAEMSLEDYLDNRLVRSSVEREFTIIGGSRREAPRTKQAVRAESLRSRLNR